LNNFFYSHKSTDQLQIHKPFVIPNEPREEESLKDC